MKNSYWLNNIVILANYILNIIFDSLVFFLTFFRTIGLAIDTKKMKVKSDFVFMFLRDGKQPFIVLKFLVIIPAKGLYIICEY